MRLPRVHPHPSSNQLDLDSALVHLPAGSGSFLKSELVARIAAKNVLISDEDASEVVQIVLDALAQALVDTRRIEIRGFGSFQVSVRPPRLGRNPRTGEAVEIAEKRVVRFKVGKELRDRINAHIPIVAVTQPPELVMLKPTRKRLLRQSV